ncbi:MAG: Fe-S-containing hydro-lyase [Caldiserica bacterium]|jgi:fumarate hydratase subunit beta|nr:Fe-S-containing hydro-lyase [Caldisericota bacterium]MDH7561803.1 Fe-S-containing hydro-lyase [Caldisericota bacterium]
MPQEIRLKTPLRKEDLKDLKIGDRVLLSGKIYTARDAAHRRLAQLIKEGKELPIELQGQAIYYVGPTPPKPGQVIGSAGPTTSERMDPYSPILLDLGLKAMIGKGQRSPEVVEAIKRNGAVYLAATGGVGVLLAKAVKSSRTVAYEELGAEAIRELEVEDLPLIVAIDPQGNDLYVEGVRQYCLL